MEMMAVEADDASGLLAAMLERMQAECGQGCGVGMIEDAEDAALLVQPILLEPGQSRFLGFNGFCHGPPPPPIK
jgi:hypothetical protein